MAIIRQIKSIQRTVLEQFHIQIATLLVSSGSSTSTSTNAGLGVSFPHTPALRDVKRMREALLADDEAKSAAASWTLECADESEQFLAEQYRQTDAFHAAAAHCHARLQDLLETKDRYAGIISAWEAVANSVELSNQGKSIMLFSVLSIIFVSPLFYSFFAVFYD